MSGVLSGAVVAGQALAALIRVLPRRIDSPHGIIIPDCIIEEVSRDTLEITDHPVEQGAKISDHAYNKPREVTLRWSWSNSYLGRYDTFMQDQYNILAGLQATREPFFIYTGKTRYQNMLVQSLGIVTDSSSEYTLNAVMVCREVIRVSTSSTQVPQSAMSNPPTTGPNVGRGQIALGGPSP